MKPIETLLQMEASGYSLLDLCRMGLVSPSIPFYKDIYLYVDARLKCGQSRTQAVTDAEEQFGVKKTTVYKALKIMSAK